MLQVRVINNLQTVLPGVSFMVNKDEYWT